MGERRGAGLLVACLVAVTAGCSLVAPREVVAEIGDVEVVLTERRLNGLVCLGFGVAEGGESCWGHWNDQSTYAHVTMIGDPAEAVVVGRVAADVAEIRRAAGEDEVTISADQLTPERYFVTVLPGPGRYQVTLVDTAGNVDDTDGRLVVETNATSSMFIGEW